MLITVAILVKQQEYVLPKMWLRRPLIGEAGDEAKVAEMEERLLDLLYPKPVFDLGEEWGEEEEEGLAEKRRKGKETKEWRERMELAIERAKKYAILLRWHPEFVRFSEAVRGEHISTIRMAVDSTLLQTF